MGESAQEEFERLCDAAAKARQEGPDPEKFIREFLGRNDIENPVEQPTGTDLSLAVQECVNMGGRAKEEFERLYDAAAEAGQEGPDPEEFAREFEPNSRPSHRTPVPMSISGISTHLI